jgi:hypothetical protein
MHKPYMWTHTVTLVNDQPQLVQKGQACFFDLEMQCPQRMGDMALVSTC